MYDCAGIGIHLLPCTPLSYPGRYEHITVPVPRALTPSLIQPGIDYAVMCVSSCTSLELQLQHLWWMCAVHKTVMVWSGWMNATRCTCRCIVCCSRQINPHYYINSAPQSMWRKSWSWSTVHCVSNVASSVIFRCGKPTHRHQQTFGEVGVESL